MPMPSLRAKKPRRITAQSISLVDATGKTRILMDAGSADGHASIVSGGMKVVESWRFEIPFSSAAFSSNPSL